jgi:predicted ATPase/transcriptional regulator with XRE-family HTH domain
MTGLALRELRRQKRLSQSELAEKASIDVTYLSKLENGRQRGSERVLRSLAEALGVPPAQLLLERLPDDLRPAVVTPPALPGGLPSPPVYKTRFIDRADEIALFHQVWQPGDVVTLIGPPGCGKTRLAAKLSEEVTGRGTAVAWLTVREGDVADRIAAEVAAAPAGAVVVLDDADLAISASVHAVQRLLGAGLTVLATSRQPLNLYGERLLPLAGLPVPDKHLLPNRGGEGPVPDLEQLKSQASVSLFVDRAALADPAFQLDLSNATAVFDVCRWLDGLPLAIELAALRLRQMTVIDLAGRLDDLLSWLGGNTAFVPARHASLDTAIEWSFAQLPPERRAVALRLCTFSTAFDINEAVAVASDDEHLPPQVVSAAVLELVDRSLLIRQTNHGRATYRWPHSIRQHGKRELERGPDAARTWERYEAWCWRFLDSLKQKDETRPETEWARLPDLTPDLLATVHRMPPEEQPEAITRLADAWPILLQFGGRDGQRLLEHQVGKPEGQPDVFRQAGIMARISGNFEAAQEHCSTAYRIASNERNVLAMANALLDLAENGIDRGDHASARTYLEQANTHYREAGYKPGLVEVLNLQGTLRLVEDDPAGATKQFEDAYRLALDLEDARLQAYSLQNLGIADCVMRRIASARGRLKQSLDIRENMQNLRGAAKVVEAFALVESETGSHAVALQLLGAARQYRSGSRMLGISPWWKELLDQVEEDATLALASSPDEVERLVQRGAAMSLWDAGRLALSTMPATALRGPLDATTSTALRHRVDAPDGLPEGGDDVATPLDDALRELAGGSDGVAEANRCLRTATLLALGEPVGGRTEDVLAFVSKAGSQVGLLVPVFTRRSVLDEVVRQRREWAGRPVVRVRYDQLSSSLLPDETVVVNPWLPSEYRFSLNEHGYLTAAEPVGSS